MVDAVRRLVSSHMQCQADHSLPLWSLMILELWHQEFLDSVASCQLPVRGKDKGPDVFVPTDN